MKEFWSRHAWRRGETQLHWLIVFDDLPAVSDCYAAHKPVLERFSHLIDIVPVQWLHMTLQALCSPTAVTEDETLKLLQSARDRLSSFPGIAVQLGPPRIDGGAVTWAVYPEELLAQLHEILVGVSVGVLGSQRVAVRKSRWWPHVTLGYGARDDPADDLAAALTRERLPRADVTVRHVALVDEVQDLSLRQYRWREIERIPLGSSL